MGSGYLIDTNVIIDFSENKFPVTARSFIASIIDDDPILSVISQIEILGFSSPNSVAVELVDCAIVIGLSDDIINKTIAIRKVKRIKLPDAIIAATCVVHSLSLVTRNVYDFQNIRALKVINPWDK